MRQVISTISILLLFVICIVIFPVVHAIEEYLATVGDVIEELLSEITSIWRM